MDAASGEDSDDEDFDTAVKFGDLCSIKFRVQEDENKLDENYKHHINPSAD